MDNHGQPKYRKNQNQKSILGGEFSFPTKLSAGLRTLVSEQANERALDFNIKAHFNLA